ncbi:type II toxin-antitoxin system VapC family toxin [Candidatus Hakubella thermalkaliphila]|uniref:type II toxin-antitoxin system VapC family toxin n=1 Tax=Candidatus Hakubella thermalkaliphila TaxID=2754717 RepID=UPI001C615305|nr:hypothetical protein [Candidatus Hakubella thermalkaliphila]
MERVKVFIDSDIFIRDLRYPKDQRFRENSAFLEQVYKGKLKGFTSIYNVLEVCGILSFNLSEERLLELYAGFRDKYNLQILFPKRNGESVCFLISELFLLIGKKLSFGDALIASMVEQNHKALDGFISWNAEHFKDKLSVEAITPPEIL